MLNVIILTHYQDYKSDHEICVPIIPNRANIIWGQKAMKMQFPLTTTKISKLSKASTELASPNCAKYWVCPQLAHCWPSLTLST
jgi:hypothetical protein